MNHLCARLFVEIPGIQSSSLILAESSMEYSKRLVIFQHSINHYPSHQTEEIFT
jgi:hypothetical protein